MLRSGDKTTTDDDDDEALHEQQQQTDKPVCLLRVYRVARWMDATSAEVLRKVSLHYLIN
jgi:hypothetical protein